MDGTQISFVGNLASDPEARFTPGGTAVSSFRVAVNNRVKRGNDYIDGETTFYNVSVWRDESRNVAESLHKGDRVLVSGKLTVRTWETQEGETRTALEVNADELGASMRWATLKVSRVRREQQGGQDAKPSGGGEFRDEAPF